MTKTGAGYASFSPKYSYIITDGWAGCISRLTTRRRRKYIEALNGLPKDKGTDEILESYLAICRIYGLGYAKWKSKGTYGGIDGL